jgi:hypothetical protein
MKIDDDAGRVYSLVVADIQSLASAKAEALRKPQAYNPGSPP